MTKILFNGLLLNENFSGVSSSINGLVQALSAIESGNLNLEVIVGKQMTGELKPGGMVKILSSDINSASRVKRIWHENFGITAAYKRYKYDVYHSPGYILPLKKLKPSIVTIHDIIALQFPELCKWDNATYFRFALPYSIKTADRIIAVSEKVKGDILKMFPEISPDKIVVIYHGINKGFLERTASTLDQVVRNKYNLPNRYILYVGNIEPKKNLVTLLKAYHELKLHTDIEHKLVIAGRLAWRYNDFLETIAKLKLHSEVVMPGFIDECDLPAIYAMADVFVFPSLYEGFGIPPVEALASGVPVVASDRGALPEVTGGYCHFVDPENAVQMARTIYRVINDSSLRYFYSKSGSQWATQFSWRTTAEKTLAQYAMFADA